MKKLFIILMLVLFSIVSYSQERELSDYEKYKLEQEAEDYPNIQEEVFYIVEDMPKFNDKSAKEFRKYIAQNVKYPVEAAKNGIEGEVIIQFVVDKYGDVVNVEIKHPVNTYLDAEAIRVVESSPKWKPGKQKEIAVNVQFAFPIKFILDVKEELVVNNYYIESDFRHSLYFGYSWNYRPYYDPFRYGYSYYSSYNYGWDLYYGQYWGYPYYRHNYWCYPYYGHEYYGYNYSKARRYYTSNYYKSHRIQQNVKTINSGVVSKNSRSQATRTNQYTKARVSDQKFVAKRPSTASRSSSAQRSTTVRTPQRSTSTYSRSTPSRSSSTYSRSTPSRNSSTYSRSTPSRSSSTYSRSTPSRNYSTSSRSSSSYSRSTPSRSSSTSPRSSSSYSRSAPSRSSSTSPRSSGSSSRSSSSRSSGSRR